MKKGLNIYFITSIFPNYDSDINMIYGTTFLYKYAKELVKLGNKVTIIHMSRFYPKIFDKIALLLSMFGMKKYKKFVIPKEVQNTKEYSFEGINVIRFKYKKKIPHSILSRIKTKKYSNKIFDLIEKDKNVPDVIISDFLDCGLPIIYELNKKINCPKMQIIHNSDYLYLKNKRIRKMFPVINKWLFRSKPQKEKLDKYLYGYNYEYIFSGIDDKMLNINYNCRTKIENLLYVGKLIKIKGLDTILNAMHKISDDKINLKVVGSGSDEEYYKKLVNKLNLNKRVEFIGQVSHNDVFKYMDNADAMVLISHETFGMVYIEAMSRGCIPVGAYNEGIDGIVLNKYNGFLSHYGDSEELADLLNKISCLSTEEVSEISKKAYETANSMTDQKLAKKLIDIIKRSA